MTRTIHVCSECGSPRVLQDAYVSINDPTDVRTYDYTVCEDCGGGCRTKEVQVGDDFSLAIDFYKEQA